MNAVDAVLFSDANIQRADTKKRHFFQNTACDRGPRACTCGFKTFCDPMSFHF